MLALVILIFLKRKTCRFYIRLLLWYFHMSNILFQFISSIFISLKAIIMTVPPTFKNTFRWSNLIICRWYRGFLNAFLIANVLFRQQRFLLRLNINGFVFLFCWICLKIFIVFLYYDLDIIETGIRQFTIIFGYYFDKFFVFSVY